jgi:hypothetical protein
MSSRCPLPDCGFQTDDGEQFNAHMRGHDEAQQHAREAVEAQMVQGAVDSARELAELDAKKFSAQQMTAAFNVIAPLVRALRLLMSDPKMREFVIETALDFWREINPSKSGTDPVSIPVSTETGKE